MKKFLVLYRAPVSAKEQMAQATPEQMEAGMAHWNRWMEKHGESVAEPGSPLACGKHIAAGSVTDGDGTITGYSIVQSESVITATKLMHDHPHFHMPGGSIEVFEFRAMPAA